jgi:hypothetical protein
MKKRLLIAMALIGVIIFGFSAEAPAPLVCPVFETFDFTIGSSYINEDGHCIIPFTFQATTDPPDQTVYFILTFEDLAEPTDQVIVQGEFLADGSLQSGEADLGPACECTYGLSGTAYMVSGATALMSVEPSICGDDVCDGIGDSCIEFSSPEPVECYDDTPPGDEGCTPGYWKNYKKHGDEWSEAGYHRDYPFKDAFGVELVKHPDLTLKDALSMGGGGFKKLVRHGTAALLSAAHPEVDYPLTKASVISGVKNAFQTGEAGFADTLADYNELGCPLN